MTRTPPIRESGRVSVPSGPAVPFVGERRTSIVFAPQLLRVRCRYTPVSLFILFRVFKVGRPYLLEQFQEDRDRERGREAERGPVSARPPAWWPRRRLGVTVAQLPRPPPPRLGPLEAAVCVRALESRGFPGFGTYGVSRTCRSGLRGSVLLPRQPPALRLPVPSAPPTSWHPGLPLPPSFAFPRMPDAVCVAFKVGVLRLGTCV